MLLSELFFSGGAQTVMLSAGGTSIAAAKVAFEAGEASASEDEGEEDGEADYEDIPSDSDVDDEVQARGQACSSGISGSEASFTPRGTARGAYEPASAHDLHPKLETPKMDEASPAFKPAAPATPTSAYKVASPTANEAEPPRNPYAARSAYQVPAPKALPRTAASGTSPYTLDLGPQDAPPSTGLRVRASKTPSSAAGDNPRKADGDLRKRETYTNVTKKKGSAAATTEPPNASRHEPAGDGFKSPNMVVSLIIAFLMGMVTTLFGVVYVMISRAPISSLPDALAMRAWLSLAVDITVVLAGAVLCHRRRDPGKVESRAERRARSLLQAKMYGRLIRPLRRVATRNPRHHPAQKRCTHHTRDPLRSAKLRRARSAGRTSEIGRASCRERV